MDDLSLAGICSDFRLTQGVCDYSGPEPLDPEAVTVYEQSVDPQLLAIASRLAEPVEARPVALCVDGTLVWTELDKDRPEAALMRYFAGIARQQLAKIPNPDAKPALAGLMRTGGSRCGPGWCDE